MIKFTAKGNGKTIIGLGLSRRNLELLLQDKPIVVKLSDLRLSWPCEILILADETEDIMFEKLKSYGLFIDTEIIDERSSDHQNGNEKQH